MEPLRLVNRAWLLLVAAFALSCLGDSTAPRMRSGHLALVPAFTSSAAGIADFDRVRITLTHPDSTSVLDTVIAIAATADSIDLAIAVPLTAASEDFLFYLRLVNAAGDTVFRNTPYPQRVTITAGGAGTPVETPIVYVGVGFDALAVVIGTPDTFVTSSQTLQLNAVALGLDQQPIPGTPIAWRSLDSTRVRVPDRAVGQVVGGAQRGKALIVAQLLTGPADTVAVTAQPVASTLSRVSGDSQTTVPGAVLPAPLRVRVLAADGLGVRVPVRFRALSPGASVSDSVVVSDSTGYAEARATLGPGVGAHSFEASVVGLTPVTFRATAVSGTVASVTLDRTVDTIPRGATLQYTATARDSLGNPVSVTIGWTSTVPAVATVDAAGLAHAVDADSTRIIASAAGHADTARLYVRALRSVVLAPADTVITAVGDSFDLRATAYDNFGAVLTTGFTRRFISASPTVVTVNAATGRTRSVGPGNGVVVVRDSVDPTLKVQGTATVRVNQVTASIQTLPALPDSLKVGVNGKGQIVARARDRNGYQIPGKTFRFVSRDPAIASVDAAGLVTGLLRDSATFVVDSLADSAGTFKDSVFVAVIPAPPALLQWGFDSLAVGNGGNVSVPLSLSRTDSSAVWVLLTSSDTTIARPAAGCPGAVLKRIPIPANTSAASVLLCGLAAGRVTMVAQDSAGVFLPDTMVVTVVSTIEFREIGQFARQTNFYVNQNETHQAQVFLSDPAPAGGLGVTFVYGRAGTSAVTPAPAIIPAGQLSAPVTIQGLSPGRDSIVPTSGGFVGKFAYVDVAPDSLRLSIPYPYAVGVGQTTDPYVYYTYAMDHPLVVSLSLTPAIGTVPGTVTVPTNSYYSYFTVRATAVGTATVTATAPGWVAASGTITFTTPQLGASGTGSMVAGDPAQGSWTAYTEDSIMRYSHPVADTVVVTATSRNTAVVAVDVPVGKVLPGQGVVTVYNALRAQPGAGGDSTWIVLMAPGYRPDSFQVRVTAPALTFGMSYPNQVLIGGRFQNAGYVQIPYVRPDSFTVVFQHSRRGAVAGPDSVTIPKGLTYEYFDIVGDTLGVDTIGVARATGYTLPAAQPFNVVPLHVAINTAPATLYTISRPQRVGVYVHQETPPYYSNSLVAPLQVSLTSSNTAAFTLDSGRVTIPAGTYVSTYDTLRVNAGSPGNDSGRILITAPGSTPDSSGIIHLLPTPLTLYIPYPQQAGWRLRLPGGYVCLPDVPTDTLRVGLTRRFPAVDTLSADTLKIPPTSTCSGAFEITALDSVGTDSITASAPGFVSFTAGFTAVPAQIDVQDIGANQLTTTPPVRMSAYTRMRSGAQYAQNTSVPVAFTIVSTDSSVIQVDSAGAVSPTAGSGTSTVPVDQYYGYFKVRFVGSGSARIVVSAPGYGVDSTTPISVTGPVLHLGATSITVGVNQIYPYQYVHVDNPVPSDLVVRLARSDSTQPAASQAFHLSADSVIIPAGGTSSGYFDIVGNAAAAAQLFARATGYGQATATVQVGPPQLSVPPTMQVFVGAQPANLTVSTLDQTGGSRLVATTTTVDALSSDATVAATDNASQVIPIRGSYATFNVQGFKKGAVALVFSSTGYRSDTTVVTVDSGKLDLQSAPNGLGPNQVAQGQAYVQLPFSTGAPLTVSLTSSSPAILTVPASVTILAGSYYAFFDVTGVALGAAAIIATAPSVLADSMPVTISMPKLLVSLPATVITSAKTTLSVFAQDGVGTTRNVTAPLTVTVTSSNPSHTALDSTTITLPVGQSYVSTGVVFDTAGSFTLTATATGYTAGTAPITAAGALVSIADFSFTPDTVTIRQGQYVTWKNTGPSAHTSTSDTGIWNINDTPAGQTSASVYFGTPGTYPYHCTNRPTMRGAVVVTP